MSNSITVSPNASSVIIGQRLTLNVILTSDTPMSSDVSIYVQNRNNINLLDESSSITLTEGGRIGSISLSLEVKPDISNGDSVSFYVVRSDTLQQFMVEYTAKKLDNDSLRLTFDLDTLHVPDSANIPPEGKIFSRVMATIKDEQGNRISGLPVSIYPNFPVNMEKVTFYAVDQKTQLTPYQFNNDKKIILTSNDHGRLIFYVYPEESKALVLSLYSKIDGVTNEIRSYNDLVIINKNSTNDDNKLSAPKIQGFDRGELTTGGQTTFLVAIPSYDDAQVGDLIHFLVQGTYGGYHYTIKDLDELNRYSIPLPYYMFPVSQDIGFSYTVIGSILGDTPRYSQALELTYTGDSWPKPTFYDACVVYSSLGTDNPSNIVEQADPVDCADIEQDSIINCNTIKKYKDNKNDSGLFIQITGTNDISDKTKPPLGGHVTLTLSITSNPRVLHHSFSGYIPSQPGADGTTAVTTIGIDHKWLTGCGKYENCQTGLITFTYSVTSNNQTAYSSTWKGRIDTIPSGAIDCGD
ncbi:hypothetical protein M5U04_14560 [Xenorhabdus sp. XENO-1]|uniref:hypothetical protein n=1 Tax=Xenorhabdus bovienii TaxID=40576 RepID=UPI0020CA5B84|nr:hypothetical protein [Xenorhabdus bovienii]MCP9269276.1 hypothetical protein [Xenorhabdus bovienii subsp. africana]